MPETGPRSNARRILGLCLVGALFSGATQVLARSFKEDFSHLTGLPVGWEIESGAWAAENGRLVTPGHPESVCRAPTPDSGRQTFEITVIPRARVGSGGWAVAGLALYQDAMNHWRLGLVEGPDGGHYAELSEMFTGAWQAQTQPRTALPARGDKIPGFIWKYGEAYRLRITLTQEAILAEVFAAKTKRAMFRAGFSLPLNIGAVRSGGIALTASAMGAAFDDLNATVEPESARSQTRPGPPVAVVLTGPPPSGGRLAMLLVETLRAEGFAARQLDAARIADPATLDPAAVDLVVLANGRDFPAPSLAPLERFLEGGGHLLVFGGPAFQNLLWPVGDQWLPRAEALAQVASAHTLVDWSQTDLKQWQRSTDRPDNPETHRIARTDEGAALQVEVGRLTGWDTLGADFANPFPAGQSLTIFRARGGPDTTALLVEWRERDGSRWIATVPLTTEWKRYVLAPSDFRFWADGSPTNRGGRGDAFQPSQASRLVCGVARGHGSLRGDVHSYWVGEVSTAPSPLTEPAPEPPKLEALSPWHKVYELPNVARAQVRADQTWVPADLALPGPFPAVAALARPRGLGLGTHQPGRWIPLLEAYDDTGAFRGTIASAYLSLAAPYRRALWTTIGITDPDYVVTHFAKLCPLVVAAAHAARGPILVQAGAKEFAYRAGEQPQVGGRVINLGAEPSNCDFVMQLRSAGSDEALWQAVEHLAADRAPGPGEEVPVTLPPVASSVWAKAAADRYEIETVLRRGDRTLDRVMQEIVVLDNVNPSPSQFIRVEDGQFVLDGRPWYPHGINYWPSNATGLEPFAYWLHWLDPAFYDPEVVERDLAAMHRLGINAVSIQLNARSQVGALNHFLSRAADYDIYANVFLNGAHPLMPDENLARDLIVQGRLADSPAIFAYDIAWEPRLGLEGERRRWDPDWRAWIQEQYGGVENAERDWGMPARRDEKGEVTGPADAQLSQDGPWRILVAAYRRFADDLISRRFHHITDFVRTYDPNHLIGARTGYGGNGQMGINSQFPYDVTSGAKYLDFISAEGWGLAGPWKNFEPAGFTTAYARWAGQGKPVFWAEFGATIYPDITPQKYEDQRLVYENMYRMVLESNASGSAGWWYPGGLRIDENSDFGIMNPDGTPRPAAVEVQKAAPAIKAPRPVPQPQVWLIIDRDADARGYAAVWERGRDAYLAAVRAGKTPGLRTEGTGTTSADCPLVAVGNVPRTGSNPPKYLNAEFNRLRLRSGEGNWQELTDGGALTVRPGAQLQVEASLGNTGEATWLAPATSGAGAVYLVAQMGDRVLARCPLAHDTARYADGEFAAFDLGPAPDRPTEITFRLEAQGLTPFGQRLRITVAPKS